MNKILGFEGIGYVAATFEVDETTKGKLLADHLNPATGNVDVNGKKLAVKMGNDGKVGFGTGSEALIGIIVAYEMDGFCSVQIKGGVEEVPTAAALKAGVKGLAVDANGAIVEAEGGKQAIVAKPSEAEELFATIIL